MKREISKKEAFTKELASIFDSTFVHAIQKRATLSKGTDILGGFKQADKYHLENQNNLIVIFSDMILNETEDLNLDSELQNSSIIKLFLKKVEIC